MSVVGNTNKYVMALRRFEKDVHTRRQHMRLEIRFGGCYRNLTLTVSTYSHNEHSLGSIFVIVVIGRFDVRQKPTAQSTIRAAMCGNPRQWGRIRMIWLRHGTLPHCLAQAGERLVSLSPARLWAEPRSGMICPRFY